MSISSEWQIAINLAKRCQEKGGIVVSTNGCFDLIHRGPVEYLQQARALGDILIVGLNSDASVKRLKGLDRPINDELSRKIVLSALRSVDAVCVFEEDTPIEWLSQIKPNIHVKGGDWVPDKMPEKSVLDSWGGQIKIIPYLEGHSSTKLIEKRKQ